MREGTRIVTLLVIAFVFDVLRTRLASRRRR
jgi:hypothetical protein